VQLDADLASDLVSRLCLKDYVCAINPLHHLAKIFEISVCLFPIHLPSIWRDKDSLNLEE